MTISFTLPTSKGRIIRTLTRKCQHKEKKPSGQAKDTNSTHSNSASFDANFELTLIPEDSIWCFGLFWPWSFHQLIWKRPSHCPRCLKQDPSQRVRKCFGVLEGCSRTDHSAFLLSCILIKPFCPVVPYSRNTWYTFIGLTCDLSRPHLCIDIMYCSLLQLLQEIIKSIWSSSHAAESYKSQTSAREFARLKASWIMFRARHKKWAQLLLFAKINPIYLWSRSLTTYAVGQRLIKLHQSLYTPSTQILEFLKLVPTITPFFGANHRQVQAAPGFRGIDSKMTRNPFIP